jgi:hypothetical protein
MDQVVGLEAGRLLAHGGEFTADEFGTLALLSLPVLVLSIAFVAAAYLRRGQRRTGDDAGPAAVQRNAHAETVQGGVDADPS